MQSRTCPAPHIDATVNECRETCGPFELCSRPKTFCMSSFLSWGITCSLNLTNLQSSTCQYLDNARCIAKPLNLSEAETKRSIQHALDRTTGPQHLLHLCYPAELKAYIAEAHEGVSRYATWEALLPKKGTDYRLYRLRTEEEFRVDLLVAVWRNINHCWEVKPQPVLLSGDLPSLQSCWPIIIKL